MRGEHCIVVCPGPSAGKIPHHRYQSTWTITCNRAASFGSPDFAVCVEPPNDKDCWSVIDAAAPMFVFSQHTRRFSRVITWAGRPAWKMIHDQCSRKIEVGSSAFFAGIAAIALGFDRIGFIGLDLDPKRFSSPAFRQAAENGFGELAEEAKFRHSRILNLNPRSHLKALEHGSFDQIKRKGE